MTSNLFLLIDKDGESVWPKPLVDLANKFDFEEATSIGNNKWEYDSDIAINRINASFLMLYCKWRWGDVGIGIKN